MVVFLPRVPNLISVQKSCKALSARFHIIGEVAEWLKAAVLKTVKDREVLPEFESLPLRQLYYCSPTVRDKES